MTEMRKFPHHLIREIFEQPDALRRTIEPRVSLADGSVQLVEVRISARGTGARCTGSISSLPAQAVMQA